MRSSDEQVYAEPSKISERISRATNALGAPGKVARELYLPFMKRPSNSIVDFFQTYVGAPLNIPAQAMRMMTGGFSAEAQSRFAKSVGRGTVGYSLIGLGYALAASGHMKGVVGDDKDSGSLVIGGHAYPVWKVPFVGWLLGLGATIHDQGVRGVPAATAKMIKEHPLLRGIEGLGTDLSETLHAAAKGDAKALEKKAVSMAGRYASRLVPQPLPVLAEGTDAKERVMNQSVAQPTLSRIPGARETLDPYADKSRLSIVDPFYTPPAQPKQNSPGWYQRLKSTRRR
jgi:hypothetical protein